MDPQNKRFMERFSKMPLSCSDGGREADGFTHETRDCTVRAVACGAAVTYAEAHALLATAGRKDCRGAYFVPFMDSHVNAVCPLGGYTVYRVPRVRMTLRAFAQTNPKGRYILTVRGHALAVIDGVVHDNQTVRSRSIVTSAWRLCFSLPPSAG